MMREEEYKFHQNIVSFGGGTGHFTWLRGAVKLNFPEYITAVVATWDSGGVSGILRIKEGALPPGDYNQCIFGLMEDDEQLKEAIIILRDRTETYTDDEDEKIKRHPLIHVIAAKSETAHHSVEGGIDGMRKLFRVRGEVLPVSLIDTHLHTETRQGAHFKREHELDELENDARFSADDEIVRIYLDPQPDATPKVLDKIKEAHKLIKVPGSPYGSIFPHLVVSGIPEAIRNSEGKLILISNLMTTQGQDRHLNLVSNWLQTYQYYLRDDEYIKEHGKSRIDYLIVNENHISDEIVSIYRNKGQDLVRFDEEKCRKMAPGMQPILGDFADYDRYSHLFRHNPLRLAETVLSL